MIELQHRSVEPEKLREFRRNFPNAGKDDFNGPNFSSAKRAVKAALHEDQDGMCAYCERLLSPDSGQIDHIKPKGGANAHPHLCFTYTNFAHSCIDDKTCGQKKKDGLLPIEPGPGCNDRWELSTNGKIEPLSPLSRSEKHNVKKTRDMLGLNTPDLTKDREEWFKSAISTLERCPDDIDIFLQDAPFRVIIAKNLGLSDS